MALRVGDGLEQAIQAHVNNHGLGFRRIQCEFANKLLQWRKTFSDKERDLHLPMPVHLRRVLAKKRVLVFKQALEDIDYPDVKVADEMAGGFPLRAWLPASGVFPGQVRVPSLHLDTLVSMAKVFTAALMLRWMNHSGLLQWTKFQLVSFQGLMMYLTCPTLQWLPRGSD